jgi:hypothetical protein
LADSKYAVLQLVFILRLNLLLLHGCFVAYAARTMKPVLNGNTGFALLQFLG